MNGLANSFAAMNVASLPRWRELRAASPVLSNASLVFTAFFALCLALQLADPRLFNGIGVWVKPAKFLLSLALHMVTLAWGLSLLPRDWQASRAVRIMAIAFAAIAVLEVGYIAFRAARAEASHFNISSPTAGFLYSLMGVGAVTMLLITAIVGWLVLRHGKPRDLAFAMGLGFILAAILTVIVAGYLGNQASHWVGGERNDASGLPLAGWSTTGGDLRAAHFVALHVMQAVPLAGLLGGRAVSVVAAILGTALTAALFVQALLGVPLLAL